MTRTRQRRAPAMLTAALLTLAVCIVAPATALAGSYQVSSCDNAGGAQNAWTADSNNAQMPAYSACPSYGDWGRGIIARNAIPASGSIVVPYGAAARQWFTAPAGTGITNVRFSGQIFRAFGQRWNVGLSNGSQILEGASASNTNGWSWTTTNADIAVPGNQTVYWETACYQSGGCDTRSTGDPATHYVRAALWISGTVVTINDPTAPALSWGGSLLSGGWLRGEHSLAWYASDNSGIANATANLAGRQVIGSDRPCDFTRPQPCAGSDSGSTTVATAAWPDGQHQVDVTVRDAAGNPAQLATTVAIDNTAPGRIASVTVDGGEGWRATNSFTLHWTTPTGQAAPIVRRHVRLCAVDGSGCTDTLEEGATASTTLSVPRVGAWRAQVWLEDAAGNTNAGNASDPVTLRYDNTAPPAARLDVPAGWIGDAGARQQALSLRLADGAQAPPSGIAGHSVTTDGSTPDASVDTDGTWMLSDLPDGDTTLKVRAISGAGLASRDVATATLHVDRGAPAADASGLPDPAVWQRDAVTVALRGGDARSGIAAVSWHIDDGPHHDQAGDSARALIETDGRHTLTWETIDNAGNHSQARQATIRVDRTAPDTVAFEPQDLANPRRIIVEVADRTSGVAGGTIQLRASDGGWQALDTTLDEAAGQQTATLPDDHLRDGLYELRAVVTDRAGNQRVGDLRTGGSPAILTLPVRAASKIQLAVEHPAAAAQRTQSRRGAAARTIRGALTRSDSQPIKRTRILVQTRPRTATGWRTERSLTTDDRGAFTYIAPAGPSRTIRFTYAGNDTTRPGRADTAVTTPAASTIGASRRFAHLHEAIVFSGRLIGGYVPPIGKVLELQAYDQGRWRSFPSTVRSDAHGRWRAVLRFERTAGRYTYRIRARIRPDSGYPFELGYSREIRLTISGA